MECPSSVESTRFGTDAGAPSGAVRDASVGERSRSSPWRPGSDFVRPSSSAVRGRPRAAASSGARLGVSVARSRWTATGTSSRRRRKQAWWRRGGARRSADRPPDSLEAAAGSGSCPGSRSCCCGSGRVERAPVRRGARTAVPNRRPGCEPAVAPAAPSPSPPSHSPRNARLPGRDLRRPPNTLSRMSATPSDSGSVLCWTPVQMVCSKLFHQLSAVRYVSTTFACG